MEELIIKELIRSKEEKRILTSRITGIEDEFYKLKGESIPCATLWYENIKVLIPVTHLGIEKMNKSMIRGMLGAEIDFVIIDIDMTAGIAVASRVEAMKLRSELELSKLKVNDNVKVRIIAVGVKHIIVELYGKEVVMKADLLQHTYITNCKDIYNVGESLKVKIKNIDIAKDIYELDAKCFIENPYKSIRKYITEYRRIYRKSYSIS